MGKILYDLIPEEGKHLADSRDTEGALRGVYLDNTTNKLSGAGEFMPVYVEDDEDNSSSDDDAPGNGPGGSSALALAIMIGIGIGVAATVAAPHIKKWFDTTAAPKAKKLWQKLTKKKSESAKNLDDSQVETILILRNPESFSEMVDLVTQEFNADMNNAEVQQRLLNIMCAAMYIADQIRHLSNTVLNDEEQLAWKTTFEKLSTKSVTDCINRCLQGKVLTLDKAQLHTLTAYLGGTWSINDGIVPIENEYIKTALYIHSKND